MKKLALLLIIPILVSCRTIEKTKDYNLSLSDSLWIQERTIDSIIHIPYSYLPLVVIPNDMNEGDKVEKKEGQANLSVEKKGDSLIIIASCDSLELVIKGMERQLTMVKKENQSLKEEVKKKPSFNRFHWFIAGFLTMLVLAIIIYIRRRK